MKILINAGHGGSDPGAVKKIREVDFNYPFAQKIIDRIRALGGDVADLIPSVGGSAKAVAIANAYGRDTVLLSIHANCCGGTGYEVFYANGYYSGKTQELVEAVHQAYGQSGLKDRGIKPDSAAKVGRLTILQDTAMPAALLECGFVDNDATTLSDEGFQNRMAELLARTLMSVAGQGIAEPQVVDGPQPEPLPPVIELPDGEYAIMSAQNGKCLDEFVEIHEVRTYRFHGGDNQRWIKEGEKWTNKQTGRVLDVETGDYTPGRRLITYPWHGGENQKFYLDAEGHLVVRHSNMVLDITGASDAYGVEIIQWRNHGGINQLWKFIRLY